MIHLQRGQELRSSSYGLYRGKRKAHIPVVLHSSCCFLWDGVFTGKRPLNGHSGAAENVLDWLDLAVKLRQTTN